MSKRLHAAQEDRGSVWRAGLITFSRAKGSALVMSGLGALLALSACATGKAPLSQAHEAVAAPTGPDYATVAAVRPISEDGSGGDPRADILAAMGVSTAAAATAGPAAPSEIVVRTDGGETLSVVQAGGAGFAPGERVIILPGGQPRLAAAPAS
jgi:outer membrane lipoprotein SlyB